MPSACHCLSSEDAMAYDVPPPEQCPEPGYYYHYKHDPNGPLNNYAGIVNLAAPGMLVVAWRLGSEGPLLAYCAARSNPCSMPRTPTLAVPARRPARAPQPTAS